MSSTTPQTESPAIAGWWARLAAWVSARVGRTVSPRVVQSVALGCALLGALAVAGTWWQASRRAALERANWTTFHALAALDAGHDARAEQIATLLETQRRYTTETSGVPPMVLGIVASRQADRSYQRVQSGYRELAVRWLQTAQLRGLPPERRAQALRELGHNLLATGRWTEAQAVLAEALRNGSDPHGDVRRLLAVAYLRAANPQLTEARQLLADYLSIAELSDTQRQQAWLDLAELELAAGDLPAALAAADRVESTGDLRSEQLLLTGWITMRRAAATSGPDQTRLYSEAIARLRESQQYDTLGSQTTPKAMYLIGLCYRALGDPPAALDQFQRTWATFTQTPEAVAARVEAAEVLAAMERNEESLEALRDAVRLAGDPQRYSNRWLPLDEFRNRLLSAYLAAQHARRYRDAAQLAALAVPIVRQEEALPLEAEALADGAAALRETADMAPYSEAETLRFEAARCNREAGVRYRRLAQLQIAQREYPANVWNAVRMYFAGQDYRRTLSLLDEYLSIETRQHRGEALAVQAEALLALDQFDAAATALRKCMAEHPRDPAAYQARLLLATALADRGEMSEASVLLDEILEGDLLTPASREWRTALFLSGSRAAESGQFAAGAARLEEFLARYVDDSRYLEACYLTALCHRRLAEQLADRGDTDLVLQQRLTARRDAQLHWQKSLDHYRHALEQAGRPAVAQRLSPADQAIVRNCELAIPLVLYHLGRFDEAILACQVAANRYQEHPAVLQAYVQLVACYRRIERPVEARAALEQAKVVLSRLPETARFAETTSYSRQQWQGVLDALAQL